MPAVAAAKARRHGKGAAPARKRAPAARAAGHRPPLKGADHTKSDTLLYLYVLVLGVLFKATQASPTGEVTLHSLAITHDRRRGRKVRSAARVQLRRLFAMATARVLARAALAALCAALAAAQVPPAENATLFSRVVPVIDLTEFNDATAALFMSDTLALETPVAIRMALGLVVLDYDRLAACHPVALGFLGRRIEAGDGICADGPRSDVQAELYGHMLLRWLRADFPEAAVRYGAHLARLGFNVTDGAAGDGTPAGFGREIADAVVAFFAKDGWNSKGDLTRENFRKRFEDTSGYKPKNAAGEEPAKLSYPLRWQPLTQSVGGQGRFISQVHVAPHLGAAGVTPLAATRAELEARQAPSPYKTPNMKGGMSDEDVVIMEALIDDLLNASANVTPLDRVRSNYYENKVRCGRQVVPEAVEERLHPQLPSPTNSVVVIFFLLLPVPLARNLFGILPREAELHGL
jgi:hypothetical protein